MHPLDWTISPEEALAHWPDDVPLAALVTCAPDPAWGRWSMLAVAGETLELHDAAEALAAIRRAGEGGTWCAAISYELGGAFEPTALPRARRPDDGWPLVTLVRCDARLEHDHATGRWHATDAARPLAEMLAQRIARGERAAAGATVTALEPDLTRADFERMVTEAVSLIHAGDVFQANVAQRFSARWQGARRAVMRAAFRAARPRYGAWIEAPAHALASMSPELFLEVDRATGRAVTRPVKGTRPAHEAPGALAASEKDAAELHMIVDLMRNDLGRVAAPGSVRVDLARAIESHETVLHGVAEVSATLRPGTGPAELLRATFPPGSVTGAPKVRAMQVIDALEQSPRGPYCGAVGLISPGRIALNVAIRTIALSGSSPAGGTLRYSAGCGIVADSVPRAEYEESLHKSAVLLRTAHALSATAATRASAPPTPPATPPSAGARG
ncbi:MAG: anthranilate synthase component I family protein [Phycisphaerales bacterium]